MSQPDGSVDVSPQARDVIHQHAIETYPHECCGALFGDAAANRVISALPLPNTTEEGPRRRFLVRPADYLAAERGAKAAGLELIASVLQGQVGDVRTWFLRDDRSQFDERPLVTS